MICNWCNGSVAMSGKSYLGTLSIAAATTGYRNLKTIIPEAAISNWYDYYRYNGLVVCPKDYQGDDIDLLSWYCQSFLKIDNNSKRALLWKDALNSIKENMDRDSGEYNNFWKERNYLNNADNIKCSILLVHGINDWNVKTSHCYKLWEATRNLNITRNMILHRGEHIYIYNLEDFNFSIIMHKWLDYYLLNVGNCEDFINEKIIYQDNINPKFWHEFIDDKEKCTEELSVQDNKLVIKEHCKKTPDNTEDINNIISFQDDLLAIGYDFERDNQVEWLNNLVLYNEGNCSKFFTQELKKDLVINGEINLDVKAKVNLNPSIMSAMLVDYGIDYRINPTTVELEDREVTLGKNVPSLSMAKFELEDELSDFHVISRGWINTSDDNNVFSDNLIFNKEFKNYRISFIATNHKIKKGHRLLLILYGQDAQFTFRDRIINKIEILPLSIKLTIPKIPNDNK